LTEGTLKIKNTPSVLIVFSPKRKSRRRKKGEKGILKRRISYIFSIPPPNLNKSMQSHLPAQETFKHDCIFIF
jgi:hypothetical protein